LENLVGKYLLSKTDVWVNYENILHYLDT